MQLSASERLKLIIEESRLSTNKFAKELNYTSAETLYKILRGEIKSISSDLANRIIANFEQFNLNWILTGEGNMIAGKMQPQTTEQTMISDERIEAIEDDVNQIKTTLQTQSEQLKQLSDDIRLLMRTIIKDITETE